MVVDIYGVVIWLWGIILGSIVFCVILIKFVFRVFFFKFEGVIFELFEKSFKNEVFICYEKF